MPYEDFEGFWKVDDAAPDSECAINSIVVFDRTDDEKVTILCAKPDFPYGEGSGSYKPDNTIEVTLNEKVYVIKMTGTPEKPAITFAEKQSGPGPATGSWTAEDYVPGFDEPEPAGK